MVRSTNKADALREDYKLMWGKMLENPCFCLNHGRLFLLISTRSYGTHKVPHDLSDREISYLTKTTYYRLAVDMVSQFILPSPHSNLGSRFGE